MTLLERIKATIFGQDVTPPPPMPAEEDDLRRFGTAEPGVYRPDVSTPVDDPILDDIASAGVQPFSKPVAIEEAQNPERRPVRPED